MTKLNNPFIGIKDYNCFGCAPENSAGLQMEFFEDGDDIVSKWDPSDHFQGYNYILHGGIRASLIDEIAAWVVFIKLKTSGYTVKLNVEFQKPAYTNKGMLTLRGRLKGVQKNIAEVEVELIDGSGEVVTTGLAEYFVIPEKIAAKRAMFPGIDAFYKD